MITENIYIFYSSHMINAADPVLEDFFFPVRNP